MKPVAPAFPNDDSFYCRFFTEVGPYQDAAGRHLHEVDFREGGETFKKCPFHDSRKGYLINQAALKQIGSEWPQILQGIKYFTSLYEVQDEQNANLARSWRISLASMFAPLYLFHRKENAYANGQLPTSVSGVFKIMLDMPTTLDLMFEEGHDRNVASGVGVETAKSIQEFANKHLILLNGKYACAGPPGMIDEVSSILFQNLKFADDQFGEWNDYFYDREQFQSFCYGMTNQYVMGLMFQMATMISMESAFEKLEAQGQIIPSLGNEDENYLSAYERRRRFTLNIVKNPSNFEGVLNQFSKLVKEPSAWNTSVENTYPVDACLDVCMDFVSKALNAAPQQTSAMHAQYSAKVKSLVALTQKDIGAVLGTEGAFPKEILLGRISETPASLLQRLFTAQGPEMDLIP